jgi:hypothetical protein
MMAIRLLGMPLIIGAPAAPDVTARAYEFTAEAVFRSADWS